jgi:DNA mismatch repair ATPase MutS
MKTDLITDYEERIQFAARQAAKMEKRINVYSLLRLAAFVALLFSIYLAVSEDSVILFVILFAILAALFNFLIQKQSVFERDKEYYKNYEAVNRNELNSLSNYSLVYSSGKQYNNDRHYYTADLDVFGEASLYHFANRTATPAGQNLLASWLSAPANKNTIGLRQEAIAELVQKNDWRLDMQARLLFALKDDGQQLPRLLKYLKTEVVFKDAYWLGLYVKLVPYLTISGLVLSIFFSAARYITGSLLLFNNRLSASQSKEIKKADLIAGKIGAGLNDYADVFVEIEQAQWQSRLCKELAAAIVQKEGPAISARVKELASLVNKLNQRLSLVINFILNALFIWNIRQVIAIERWKKNNEQNFEKAFSAIAHFEALYSLAALKINRPEWCFPSIAEGEGYTLTATTIGHPLIKPALRVANDYELQDTAKIDIITGSNMAGKSTFLRTLGINTVLALSGAPVCAGEMEVSVMTVITYMRIKDSLNESTSTFKAELDRLQMLLKAVDEEEKVFFLIDEMLRGTNSVDKYLGSKAVIEQLISKQGVGLVATHDLQIAELEKQYPDYIRNFYFDIQISEGEMLFDYKLKHGECKTFNASILLRQIGVDIPVSK